ncbi:MAG: methylated-DNA--[protein]-cysteine S-methyltransferase [Cyanobacteria bacterium J06623_7]
MTSKTSGPDAIASQIIYSVIECPLGYLLLATTDKGICTVSLGDTEIALSTALRNKFKHAVIIEKHNHHADWLAPMLNLLEGKQTEVNLPLDIQGSAFQQRVWQALRTIPYGVTRTYQDIARELDRPQAKRAVGSACGANPLALIIPCHRVLKSDGGLSGYRWGIERKRQLLAIEQGQLSLNI